MIAQNAAFWAAFWEGRPGIGIKSEGERIEDAESEAAVHPTQNFSLPLSFYISQCGLDFSLSLFGEGNDNLGFEVCV